jgi:hypothetical protein
MPSHELFHPDEKIAIPTNPTLVTVKEHSPHLATPEAALFKEVAAGEMGDKVAIAGFSVSGLGLFASSEEGTALFAKGTPRAAEFEGDIKVTGGAELTGGIRVGGNLVVDGDIQLSGADYAEDFDVVDPAGAGPGTVMVLDDSGGVRVSDTAYDRRVAGVVSGAGEYRPAVILDHDGTRSDRHPLALMGKVYCRVDATTSAIAIGDLLTTSSTPGHAMKADDRAQAFGAVLGKALQSISAGLGVVPILVTLQ